MIYDTTGKLIHILKLIAQEGSLQIASDIGESKKEVPLKLLNEETQLYRREVASNSHFKNSSLSCTCDWCKEKLKRAEAMERSYYD